MRHVAGAEHSIETVVSYRFRRKASMPFPRVLAYCDDSAPPIRDCGDVKPSPYKHQVSPTNSETTYGPSP